MNITIEQPHHAAAIDTLLDNSFGPHRAGKTVYRLRENVAPVPELSLVALEDDAVVGTIRYWPILIGGVTPTILLGPIAVASDLRSGGLGAQLIRQSLNRASAAGWRSVVLVGDAPYYSRFGFTRDLTLNMSLPGPVDLDRFLAWNWSKARSAAFRECSAAGPPNPPRPSGSSLPPGRTPGQAPASRRTAGCSTPRPEHPSRHGYPSAGLKAAPGCPISRSIAGVAQW